MDLFSALLLFISATLTATRNVLTKGYAGFSIKNREFFGIQSTIFGAGGIALIIVNAFDFKGLAPITIFLGIIYGIMLLCAQWFYTLALTQGKTAVCATIYSFGFILPTLSGAIIWKESMTIFAVLGILTVIPVLIISSTAKKGNKQNGSKKYLLPVVIAFLCSGGLGIVQKIQQKTEYADQKSSFILVAFILSFVISLLFFLAKKRGNQKITHKNSLSCVVVGSFFAVCNLLNTHLAGTLDSAIFFPAINIGSIAISVILSAIIYKERLTKRDILVLFLGGLAILLVNL